MTAPFETPYELLVTSAGRPHLLRPTLESLLCRVTQLPCRVRIHDDAVFPGRRQAVAEAVLAAYHTVFGAYHQDWPDTILEHADPPRRLGPALAWLLDQVQTPYVLYTQDDFVTVRPLPVAQALDVMAVHHLHHVRFNKRATMAVKDTWAGPWAKEERLFPGVLDVQGGPGLERCIVPATTLTVSDHWYFQTSLWRVAEIRQAFDFLRATPVRRALLGTEEVEGLVNHYFDTVRYGGDATDPRVRAVCQRTFIWGPIGEDRYVRHIGGDMADWAGSHLRSGAIDSAAQAWREIATYPGPHPIPTR